MKGRKTGGILAALLCAAIVSGVAGCGSSSSSDPIVRAAYVSTAAAGYRMSFTLQFSSAALPAPITATGTGRFDRPARAGAVNFDMDLSSIPQASAALGGGHLTMREVIDGTTVYVRLPPALAGRIPSAGGKTWFKIDLARAGATGGVPGLGSLFNNPTSTDPGQLLQYLRATSGGVSKVGADQVNGISTTHYRATIDLDKVPAALPPADQAQAKQAIASIEKTTNLHQIPVDAWIDGQNLVRRMDVTFNASLPTGQKLDIGMSVDILQYGPQPPPAVPPPAQVTDLTGALGAG